MLTGIFSTLLIDETKGKTLEDLSNEDQEGFVQGMKYPSFFRCGSLSDFTRFHRCQGGARQPRGYSRYRRISLATLLPPFPPLYVSNTEKFLSICPPFHASHDTLSLSGYL